MKPKFVCFFGGPLDGETRAVHEGNKAMYRSPSGAVHVYRPGADPLRWDYDLEASTIETMSAAQAAKTREQKRSDKRRRSV